MKNGMQSFAEYYRSIGSADCCQALSLPVRDFEDALLLSCAEKILANICNVLDVTYDFAGKTIVPFATSGSSGTGETVKYLQGSVDASATIVPGKRLNGRQTKESLAAWLKALGFKGEACGCVGYGRKLPDNKTNSEGNRIMNPNNAMTTEQIAALLSSSAVGMLATVNADGSPYTVPVHFVTVDGRFYIHCDYHGQKLENIRRDNRVCFTVWEMAGLRQSDSGEPCRTETDFESVIIAGTANMTEDHYRKRAVLREFAVKYVPGKNADNIPDEAVKKTCVIEIEPAEIMGKKK
jgi:nitroimidazol reductase NimA-like FMN-containing flavoprotein (pyridoxamine 5'-phosphate oxidase superfamily)